MAAVFTVEPNPLVPVPPRGDLATTVVGEVMAGRLAFNAQRMVRRRALVDATPDHLTFQLYHSGGFVGEIAGRPATLRRGLVVVTDMRRGLDVTAMSSNTSGLIVPHRLLDGTDLRRPPPVLDPDRNRLLAARIVALHRDLPAIGADRAPAVTAEIVAFLRRLFDPSSAPDVLDGAELDAGVRGIAERVIARDLGSPGLSPASVAEAARVSRATLYRAFAPEGVMDYVRRRRLDAVRDVLRDPAERRTLAQVAADHGFTSLSLFGRAYRARFGHSPREARGEALRSRAGEGTADTAVYGRWWRGLGG